MSADAHAEAPILTHAGAVAWLQDRQEGVPPVLIKALFAVPLVVGAALAAWFLVAGSPPAWGDLFGGFVTGTLVLYGLLALSNFWLAREQREARERVAALLSQATRRDALVTRVEEGPVARTVTVADQDGGFYAGALQLHPGHPHPPAREGAPASVWVAETGVVIGTCGALYEGGVRGD